MERISVRRAAALLRQADDILIVTHVRPDEPLNAGVLEVMKMGMELRTELFCQAAAAMYHTVQKTVCGRVDLVSAVASAMPYGARALVFSLYRIESHKSVEPSAGKVYSAEPVVLLAAAAFYLSLLELKRKSFVKLSAAAPTEPLSAIPFILDTAQNSEFSELPASEVFGSAGTGLFFARAAAVGQYACGQLVGDCENLVPAVTLASP